jgi:DNA repair exonuclease SbcCD ATPase subunit
MRTQIGNITLIMILMVGVAFAQAAAGQEPDEAHAEHHPDETQAQVDPETAESPDMMARCRQMMAERQGMMARMRETEARLNSLLAEMNAAEGDEKIDRVAEVINELVTKLGPMPREMMRTQEEVMSHMSEHMRSGGGMCPMMEMMERMGTMGMTGGTTDGAGQPEASPKQE